MWAVRWDASQGGTTWTILPNSLLWIYTAQAERRVGEACCACGGGWSRALSGWMTVCQAKGRNQKNGKKHTSGYKFRIRRPPCVGWETSNTSISWISIGGTFYLPNSVTHHAFRDTEKSSAELRAMLGSVGIERANIGEVMMETFNRSTRQGSVFIWHQSWIPRNRRRDAEISVSCWRTVLWWREWPLESGGSGFEPSFLPSLVVWLEWVASPSSASLSSRIER